MRILHVLDHGLPLQSGYSFRSRAILKAQQALGWNLVCLTGPRHSAAGPDIEEIDGIVFCRTRGNFSEPSPIREWKEVGTLRRRLDQMIFAWRPDQIHVHSPVLNALAALPLAKRYGIPLLYEIRAFWEDASVGNGTGREGSIRYRLIQMLETYAARRADMVAVICEGLRADLISRGIPPDKIIVVPNGVDMDLFGSPPARDEKLASALELGGSDVLGFIGSFYDYEGLDDLIAAMPLIHSERPNTHLLLVGGGPMENQLKAMAAASPAASRIHFIGRVPHDEVERYYSLINVLVYPRKAMRLTELVTPLKPLEAMAQGRLVAASDVGGHRELIDDGVTGLLFPAGNPAALAETVCNLLGDRNNWDERRQIARLYVEQHRNWSSNIACYVAAYRKLTGKAA